MSSRDPASWMWAEACQLLDQAERLHRQFFQLQPGRARQGWASTPNWQPPVDIYETAEEILIIVALPGVGSGDVEVTMEEGGLSVIGRRPLPIGQHSAVIHRLEIPHGRFERHIALPSGGLRLTRQELADGCLLVAFGKMR